MLFLIASVLTQLTQETVIHSTRDNPRNGVSARTLRGRAIRSLSENELREESEVHVGGIEFRPGKIKKEKHRAAHVSAMDMLTDSKMETNLSHVCR